MTRANNSLARRLLPLLGLVAAAGWLLAAGPARADRLPDDPVESFKQALTLEDNKGGIYKSNLESKLLKGNALELAINFREKNLKGSAKKITTLGDLSRALLLLDWPVAKESKSDSEFDRRSRAIEEQVRTDLTKRFVDGARQALKEGKPGRQLAIANLVGETALTAADRGDERLLLFKGLAPLTDDLVKLTTSSTPRVSAGAARALGQFPAKPAVVAGALKTLLANPKSSLLAREAAAEALGSLVQVINSTQQIRPSEPGFVPPAILRQKPPPPLDAVSAVISAVTPVASIGLGDPSVTVRRSSASALRQAASALAFEARLMLPVSAKENPDPPGDRPWSPEERKAALERRQDTIAKVNLLRPAFLALSKQGATLLRSAKDPDPTVRLEARRTIEALARVRSVLTQLNEPVPAAKPAKKADEEARLVPPRQAAIVLTGGQVVAPVPKPLRLPPPPRGALLQDDKKEKDKDKPKKDKDEPKEEKADDGEALLRKLLESVADGLVASGFTDPKPASRRAAIEALESAGDIGKKYVPQLVKAMSDPDLFVRWIAARALGRLAPVSPEAVVPGLVALLKDDDLDVRGAASRALGQYGPAAKAAVPGLAAIAEKGDAELRLIVLKTLEDIGTASAAALPSLARALGDLDPRIREKTARLIGRFGPKARAYAPNLQRLTTDLDPEVRREASAALLAVEGE